MGGQTASGINAKSVVEVNNAVQSGGFTQASALGLDDITLGGFSFAGLDARDSFSSSSLLANSSVSFISDAAAGLNGINISTEPVNNIEALSSVERYSKLTLGGLVGVADLAIDSVKAAFVGLGTVTGSALYRTTGLDYFSGLDNDLGAFLSGTVDFVSSDNPQDLVFATLENTLNNAYALSDTNPFAAGRIYGELGSGTALGILDAAALATKAPALLSKAGQGLNSTFSALNSSTTRLLDNVLDGPLFGSPVAQVGHLNLNLFTSSTSVDTFVGPLIGRSGFRSTNELSDAVFKRYQLSIDKGYEKLLNLESQGLIEITGTNRRAFIGRYIDKFARTDLNILLKQEGLNNNLIKINRRLYSNTGGAYRVPDLRIPSAKQIFDASLEFKTLSKPQIKDFFKFSNGDRVTIIKPINDGGSYSILPQSYFNR